MIVFRVALPKSRKTRGLSDAATMLTHPELLKKDDAMWKKGKTYDSDEEDEEDPEYSTSCHLKFQQAEIQVYAHFYNQVSIILGMAF